MTKAVTSCDMRCEAKANGNVTQRRFRLTGSVLIIDNQLKFKVLS